jgi:hypothetical protein
MDPLVGTGVEEISTLFRKSSSTADVPPVEAEVIRAPPPMQERLKENEVIVGG